MEARDEPAAEAAAVNEDDTWGWGGSAEPLSSKGKKKRRKELKEAYNVTISD